MDVVGFATELARSHPAASLPCPLCVVTVSASSMERHFAKVHADARDPDALASRTMTTTWRGKSLFGLVPATLSLVDNALVLRRLGIARRVPLDGAIEVGTWIGSRPDPITATYGDAASGDVVTEIRRGRYLRLGESPSITIAAGRDTQFSKHWMRGMWQQGPKRRRCDVRVMAETFVAIEYVLARAGRLLPASASG